MYRIEFWCSKFYISAHSAVLCKYDSTTATHLQSHLLANGCPYRHHASQICSSFSYSMELHQVRLQTMQTISPTLFSSKMRKTMMIFYGNISLPWSKSCDGELQLSGSSVLPIECSLHFQRAIPSKSEGIAYFPARECCACPAASINEALPLCPTSVVLVGMLLRRINSWTICMWVQAVQYFCVHEECLRLEVAIILFRFWVSTIVLV